MIALGVVVFLGLRMLMQRQAQKMHDRMQGEVTEETARQAALQLDDEQHKQVYQAIAAEDGQRAMALFKQASGASIQDSIIAVQSLFRFPQPSPSGIRMDEEMGLNSLSDEEDIEGELVEDAIDEVRNDADSSQSVSDSESDNDDELDARARELMAEAGFNPEEELTIPQEWSEPEEEAAGFHLEVQRGEEKITLSHEDLEPWVHDQLYALLRDDKLDEAASLLASNSPLTPEEAHRFLVVFKDQS